MVQVKYFFVELKEKFTQYVHQDIQSLKKFSRNFVYRINIGAKDISELAEKTSQRLKKRTEEIVKKIKEFNVDLIYVIIEKIPQKIVGIFEREREIPAEKILPRPEKEGLVVIPSTEKAEETIQKIKASFSDEVRVTPEDESSGIIVPIFREREGQEYIYLMVPVR